MLPRDVNIGTYLNSSINAVNNAATAAVNGTAIQIVSANQSGSDYSSGQILLYPGAATGSPSALSVACQVQHSADGSTNWTNYSDPQGAGNLTLTAPSSQATINVNLIAALSYIRLQITPTLTGGSSPSIPVIGAIALGARSPLPAS